MAWAPKGAAELNVEAGRDAVNRWALLRVNCTHLLRESTNQSRLPVRPSPTFEDWTAFVPSGSEEGSGLHRYTLSITQFPGRRRPSTALGPRLRRLVPGASLPLRRLCVISPGLGCGRPGLRRPALRLGVPVRLSLRRPAHRSRQSAVASVLMPHWRTISSMVRAVSSWAMSTMSPA